jgi:dTDP-4-dehydrorhamnose reductase
MQGAEVATQKRSIALIGDRGMLAQKVLELAPANYVLHRLSRPEFDLTDLAKVRSELLLLKPDVIINCAAYTHVDGCESDAATAFLVNGEGPGNLARVAEELGATLVQVSTDYVFAGDASRPYREDDPVGPQSVYGRSKLSGEKAIINSGLKRYFIIRTSWLYGPGGKNFVETILRLAAERDELRVIADQLGSPTYTGDLAQAIFNLLAVANDGQDGHYGIYHFADEGNCSWHEFAEAVLTTARSLGLPVLTRRVVPIGTADYPLPAPRPAYSVLSKAKYRQVTGSTVPYWRDSLEFYLRNDRS